MFFMKQHPKPAFAKTEGGQEGDDVLAEIGALTAMPVLQNASLLRQSRFMRETFGVPRRQQQQQQQQQAHSKGSEMLAGRIAAVEREDGRAKALWLQDQRLLQKTTYLGYIAATLLVGMTVIAALERFGVSLLSLSEDALQFLEFLAFLGTLVAALYCYSFYRALDLVESQTPPAVAATILPGGGGDKNLLAPLCEGEECCADGLVFQDGLCVPASTAEEDDATSPTRFI